MEQQEKLKQYKGYEREIRYYETDKMAVVHHSNYARILEEARIDMMRYYGLPFDELEARGYMIPVLELSGKFVESLRFGDSILVLPKIEKIGSFRFYVSYEIVNKETGRVAHTASSVHCFLNSKFQPVSLKKEAPALYERLLLMKGQES